MRTINVNNSSSVLDQVAKVLESDTTNNDFMCCVDDDTNTVTQYEIDLNGETISEFVWHVGEPINGKVDIDC